MKGNKIDIKIVHEIVNIINSYTYIIQKSKYKTCNIPNIISRWLPFHRYNVTNYSLSILLIHHCNSPLKFYFKNKKIRERLQKPKIFQWFLKIIQTLNNNDKINLNEFDIENENDREKYKDYFIQNTLSNMNKIWSKSTVNLNSEKEERRQARLKQLKDESSYVDEKVVSEKQSKMKKVSRLTNDDYKLNFPISSEMIHSIESRFFWKIQKIDSFNRF